MNKLAELTLRVMDPVAQSRFYCDVLSMKDLGSGRIGYSSQEVALRFLPAGAPYVPAKSDLYWKIAISVPNIELAYAQLQSRGVRVSGPKQFRDVGYLALFDDPEGFSVELIDHAFQGERSGKPHDESLLGGGAHLSLVTLRTADIETVEAELLRWGMRPLSVQPVTPYCFTLYFYAFTDEMRPNPDLEAIENRVWVYQRPYTVLELQHVHGLDAETNRIGGAAGYDGLTIITSGTDLASDQLKISSVADG